MLYLQYQRNFVEFLLLTSGHTEKSQTNLMKRLFCFRNTWSKRDECAKNCQILSCKERRKIM